MIARGISNLFILAICLGISAVLTAPAYAADLEKGTQAYINGDFEAAVAEWLPLAEAGDAGAQLRVANMYFFGLGVAKDMSEAIKWYRSAAEQGGAGVQASLGDIYYNGWGVAQNPDEALKWYRLAAQQNNADAQFG